MTITRALSEAVLDGGLGTPPAAALDAANASLVDAVSVTLAATGLEPAVAPFPRYVRAIGGTGEARFFGGGGLRVPAGSAALVNGALGHALDFEDTFDAAGGHPNAIAIPVLLALGELTSASGAEVLSAMAVGAELTCRLGLGLRRDPAALGWYHPPMLGTLGAVLGAARLLRLEPGQTADALSLAMTGFSLTAELKRSPDSTLRAVRDGLAARAAVEAVRLALAGVRGFVLPLEGEAGFFRQISGAEPDEDAILDGLGTRWFNTGLTIKQWPTCRGTHAAMAMARRMRDDGLAADAIERIAVTVSSPDEMLMQPLDQKRAPATVIDAKFSIPFTSALMLERGDVTLGSFLDLVPPSLAARFDYAGSFGGDPRLEGLTRFDVTLRGGGQRCYEQRRPAAATTGAVAVETLRAKFDACVVHARPRLPDGAAERLFDALLDFRGGPAGNLFDAIG
jgi:2-methylcitrate dehydratase PrpD